MRQVNEIAREIKKDWKVVNFAAKPYLLAMTMMYNIRDNYGLDTGASVVRYFLANATTWRGATARRIKAELRDMV